ncbi:MAG: hypothetical protein A2804_00130 [Candidatus Pacebacteria bacterium RIFCSPHIGHO2_01_FULL_46_10]|nr:MAG: hypothetical protein A2804_00130 [Candidatus Pacebacteria bacterium RIFCSPHIGHO2_01_FULL_46_10]
MKKIIPILLAIAVLYVALVGVLVSTLVFQLRAAYIHVRAHRFVEGANIAPRITNTFGFFDTATLRLVHNEVVLAKQVTQTIQHDLICADDGMNYFRSATTQSIDSAKTFSPDMWENMRACVRESKQTLQDVQKHRTVFGLLPKNIKDAMMKFQTSSADIDKALTLFPEFMKKPNSQYLVLLQNNMELRPTGGFLGSFAVINLEYGNIKSIDVQDIYVPDGQLKGYVPPPAPVAKYLFQTGGWHLRDANWDPDFPTAAQTLQWFFNKGGYAQNDGIIATNFSLFQQILDVMGPIYLPDYGQTVSAENMYGFTQVQTEQSFFPGSIQKQSILGNIARAVLRDLPQLSPEKQLRIFQIMLQSLNSKDMMIWMKDSEKQSSIKEVGWDGGVRELKCSSENCIADNLFIVEANVGINKTNCCVDRLASYDVWIAEDGSVTTTLELAYDNHNPGKVLPPRTYGGGYSVYLRMLKNTPFTLTSIERDGVLIPQSDITRTPRSSSTLQEYGFQTLVNGGEKGVVLARFESPQRVDLTQAVVYTLLVQRQSGLLTNEYTIRFHYPPSVTVSLQDEHEEKSGVVEMKKTIKENTYIQVTINPIAQ